MTHSNDIKTLAGGSIDYAHYVAKAHTIRSESAFSLIAAICSAFKKLGSAIMGVPKVAASAERFPLDRSNPNSTPVRTGQWRPRSQQQKTRPALRLPIELHQANFQQVETLPFQKDAN